MAAFDLIHVPARHDSINLRLEEWARWVRVKPSAWMMQPMWRFYRAPKQWETDLEIKVEINTLAAHEIERAVSLLPNKHRAAVRWAYVKPYVPIKAVQRELGVSREGLGELVHDARSMLLNRLKMGAPNKSTERECV